MIVDVGAHYGESIMEYRALWPSCDVLAFEPSSRTYQRLQENAPDNVECIHAGCSNEPGEAYLYHHSDDGSNSLSVVSEGGESVRLTTLDEEIASRGIDCIDLLKIDVEGHEAAVFAGASETIASGILRSVLVEVGFSGSRHTPIEKVAGTLEPHGFRLHSLHDQRGIGPLMHANALYLRS
jgi:FkbM family methyltransferase